MLHEREQRRKTESKYCCRNEAGEENEKWGKFMAMRSEPIGNDKKLLGLPFYSTCCSHRLGMINSKFIWYTRKTRRLNALQPRHRLTESESRRRCCFIYMLLPIEFFKFSSEKEEGKRKTSESSFYWGEGRKIFFSRRSNFSGYKVDVEGWQAASHGKACRLKNFRQTEERREMWR